MSANVKTRENALRSPELSLVAHGASESTSRSVSGATNKTSKFPVLAIDLHCEDRGTERVRILQPENFASPGDPIGIVAAGASFWALALRVGLLTSISSNFLTSVNLVCIFRYRSV
jgi:hypothetical protein